jgi:hypothetical protein
VVGRGCRSGVGALSADISEIVSEVFGFLLVLTGF